MLCAKGIVSHRSAICADTEDNENKVSFYLSHWHQVSSSTPVNCPSSTGHNEGIENETASDDMAHKFFNPGEGS